MVETGVGVKKFNTFPMDAFLNMWTLTIMWAPYLIPIKFRSPLIFAPQGGGGGATI